MASEPSDMQFPPPKDWQALERRMRDLFQIHWGATAHLNGRAGQRQHSVDIYGKLTEKGYYGVQCKLHDSQLGQVLTEEELEKEANNARGFEPKLARFILVTSGPRDAKLQAAARRIADRPDAAFPVEVLFWDDILSLYDTCRDIFDQHYCNASVATHVLSRAPGFATLPSIRTLPLPDDDAKSRLSHAVWLAQQSENAETVAPWLDRHYSEQAVYERLLQDQRQTWDRAEHELKAAPSASELNGYKAIKERGEGGKPRWRSAAFVAQGWRNKQEWIRQHREAAKHPNYLHIMAQRSGRLRELAAERRNWRPTLKDRLLLAANDIVGAEYPPGSAENIEHSRRIVAIAALLMPEPLPMLGELGQWEWESKPDTTWDANPDDPMDEFWRKLMQPPAQEGPHRIPLHRMNVRVQGREEVLFVREPGEPRAVETEFPLDGLLRLLCCAVDELAMVTIGTKAQWQAPVTALPSVGADQEEGSSRTTRDLL